MYHIARHHIIILHCIAFLTFLTLSTVAKVADCRARSSISHCYQLLPLAFLNLIRVSEQGSSTAHIGPHNCCHRIGAVLRSGKLWNTALKHWLALLTVLLLARVVSWSPALANTASHYSRETLFLNMSHLAQNLMS